MEGLQVPNVEQWSSTLFVSVRKYTLENKLFCQGPMYTTDTRDADWAESGEGDSECGLL